MPSVVLQAETTVTMAAASAAQAPRHPNFLVQSRTSVFVVMVWFPGYVGAGVWEQPPSDVTKNYQPKA
jgi:hypothetical protein